MKNTQSRLAAHHFSNSNLSWTSFTLEEHYQLHEMLIFFTTLIDSFLLFRPSFSEREGLYLRKMSIPAGWLFDNKVRIPLYKNRVIALGRLPLEQNNRRIERIQINNSRVSATHCYIWHIQFDSNTNSICYIKDVSRNGTLIGGKKMGKGNFSILRNNDVISLCGGVHFQYLANTEAQVVEVGKPSSIKDWVILSDIIGVGTFGKVQISFHRKDIAKKFYAVKTVQYRKDDRKTRVEHYILSTVNHINIIKIEESIIDFKNGVLKMFQELAIGGDLFSYLSQDGDVLQGLNESEAVFALYQVCSGLYYLHSKGIVHRDLKLDNILIMGAPLVYPHLAIADFGIAKEIPVVATPTNKGRFYMKTMVGTAEYAAPEIDLGANIVRKKKMGNRKPKFIDDFFFENSGGNKSAYYTEKVDSWSLGVVGHILFSGVSPFYSTTVEEIINKSKLGKIDLGTSKWKDVSPISKIFIQSCLQVDSSRRSSISECLNNAIFTSGGRKELMQRLLREAIHR